jgi:predicted nucleic acid-binding protein
MSYLLDTNIISELVRAKPAKAVLAWFDDVPSEALHISVLTLGEIHKGIEQMEESARREKLRMWLEHDLVAWFDKRVLPIDVAVADRWGHRQSIGCHRVVSRTAFGDAQCEGL